LDNLQLRTDLALLASSMEGDRKAFAEIFERYHDLLYQHAYNKLKDRDEANDVIQEVFVKLWNMKAGTQVQNLSAYLYTMVRNQIFSLIQHKEVVSVYSKSFQDFKESGSMEADYLIREKQLNEIINREIAALPPRMREIFELSRKDYLSNKQIAEKLNLSEHTVADQIKKALKQLRLKVGGPAIIIFYLLNR